MTKKSNVVNLNQIRIQQQKIKAKQQAGHLGLLNRFFRKVKSFFARG